MKRLVSLTAVVLLLCSPAFGINARPADPVLVDGPEGPIRVRLVGDERHHGWVTDSVPGGRRAVALDPKTSKWLFLQSDGVTLGKVPPETLVGPLAARGRRTTTEENSATSFVGGIGMWSPLTVSTGKQQVLVILVSFSDMALKFTQSQWSQRVFTASDSVPEYYKVNSYGKLSFVPAEETCGDASNDGVARVDLTTVHPPDGGTSKDSAAAEAAIKALGTCVPWSKYDTNGDGFVSDNELHLVFVFAGSEGANQCTSRQCPSLWAYHASYNRNYPLMAGSMKILGAVFYSETLDCQCTTINNMGTLCHELGHSLGLPDLYDTNGDEKSDTSTFGLWSLMNSGAWAQPANNLDAWSRAYLGWAIPTILSGGPRNLTVTALGTDPATDIVQLRGDENNAMPWIFRKQPGIGETFLVENRQKVTGKFDAKAPGSGLLVWHIKYKTSTKNDINSDLPHMVEVVPANGITTDLGSAGDTWPGSSGATRWDCDTTPNTKLDDGSYSCLNMRITDSSVPAAIKVMFNEKTLCTGKCCGNREISVGEFCEAGPGCTSCTCTGGYIAFSPPQLVCNGSAVSGATNPTCGSYGCPVAWIGDGTCDMRCLSKECNMDGNDCFKGCSADCIPKLGDGTCDWKCYTASCRWDMGDCVAAPAARPAVVVAAVMVLIATFLF